MKKIGGLSKGTPRIFDHCVLYHSIFYDVTADSNNPNPNPYIFLHYNL